MEINVEAVDIVKRTEKEAGTSGKVHVPKAWVDKQVIVCLLTISQQKPMEKVEVNK